MVIIDLKNLQGSLNMTTPGYYRFPTVHEDNIVFVAEDDLWTVSARDGLARRLTSNLGEISRPCLSPDGEYLAFTGREEGHVEVYLTPALGGSEKRITYLDADSLVVSWHPDGESILFTSNASQPFQRMFQLYRVDCEGGLPQPDPIGPARHISYGPSGGVVIGQNTTVRHGGSVIAVGRPAISGSMSKDMASFSG